MTRWIPSHERGFLGAFTMASSALGIAFGNFISGQLIITTKTWQMAFYFWGFIGVLWVYGAQSMLYNDKDSHPYISAEEKEYLDTYIIKPTKLKIPWRGILFDRAIIALICGSCGTDLWVFMNLTNIPKYFDNVLHMEMSLLSYATSLPHVLIWVSSVLSGIVVDYSIKKHGKVVWNRRFTSMIGVVFPLGFTLGMAYCRCDIMLVVIMYCLAHFMKGPYYCSLKVNHLDLTYNFAGTVMAIVNGLGCLTGIIGPLLIINFVSHNLLKEWRTVFWVVSSVSLFLHLIFVFHCSADRAEWDKPAR